MEPKRWPDREKKTRTRHGGASRGTETPCLLSFEHLLKLVLGSGEERVIICGGTVKQNGVVKLIDLGQKASGSARKAARAALGPIKAQKGVDGSVGCHVGRKANISE